MKATLTLILQTRSLRYICVYSNFVKSNECTQTDVKYQNWAQQVKSNHDKHITFPSKVEQGTRFTFLFYLSSAPWKMIIFMFRS